MLGSKGTNDLTEPIDIEEKRAKNHRFGLDAQRGKVGDGCVIKLGNFTANDGNPNVRKKSHTSQVNLDSAPVKVREDITSAGHQCHSGNHRLSSWSPPVVDGTGLVLQSPVHRPLANRRKTSKHQAPQLATVTTDDSMSNRTDLDSHRSSHTIWFITPLHVNASAQDRFHIILETRRLLVFNFLCQVDICEIRCQIFS